MQGLEQDIEEYAFQQDNASIHKKAGLLWIFLQIQK